MPSISNIATAINEIAPSFEFGKLQQIRKRLKGMRRVPSVIFNISRKSVNEGEGWAFHTGGREELQFNIGIEKEEHRFRFGVAFSLEPSPSMTDISLFLPKIDRFNDYVRINSRELDVFRMWIRRDNEIIKPDTAVRPIIDSEVEMPNFIFLGKAVPIGSIDTSQIARTFDQLLPLYCFVEAPSQDGPASGTPLADAPFAFREGVASGSIAASKILSPGLISVELRSNQIKAKLCAELRKGSPVIKLGDEIPSGNGGRIDLVCLLPSGEYDFYEIKPAVLARYAIREALPQLLEYSYRRGGTEAKKLFIVSQGRLDDDSRDY
jgi:hypothetical protein